MTDKQKESIASLMRMAIFPIVLKSIETETKLDEPVSAVITAAIDAGLTKQEIISGLYILKEQLEGVGIHAEFVLDNLFN